VCETLGSPTGVFILDPTGFPKRGDYSVGVARQWCGQLGKTENCQIGVNLTYASEHGHTFLDRRLYVPRSWAFNQERRRAAGIPDDVVFRTSWQLAYEMIGTACAEGLPHIWITGDEEFGKVPRFHDWLSEDNERYIFEVPVKTRVWLTLPRGRIRGRKRLLERLAELGPGRPRLVRVDQIGKELPRRAYSEVHIRNASKGPIRVQAVALRVRFHRGKKKARPEGWLVLSEGLDQQRKRKFFVSNAAPDSSLVSMLSAGYARWPIEQDHGQGKNETGLGHYETRTWAGWHHHTALSFLGHHFLVMQRNRLGGKISRDDGRGNAAHRDGSVPWQWQISRSSGGTYGVPTAIEPKGSSWPLETSPRSPRPARDAPARRRSTRSRRSSFHLN
jgi:SRSO17 transposase